MLNEVKKKFIKPTRRTQDVGLNWTTYNTFFRVETVLLPIHFTVITAQVNNSLEATEVQFARPLDWPTCAFCAPA